MIPDKGNTLIVAYFSSEAKLTLIKKARSGGKIARLCREAGISRKTFYKWLAIYKDAAPHLLASKLRDKRFKCDRRSIKALNIRDKSLLVNKVLAGHGSIAELCREAGISRKTCYKWLKRYKAEGKGGLASKRLKGSLHYNALSKDQERLVIDEVFANPNLSVKSLHERLRGSVGHHGIQNLLSRENLNTLARRLLHVGAFFVEPFVQVAPLYQPEMPVYRWRDLFAPFASVPKLIVTDPRRGLSALSILSLPFLVTFFFFRMVSSASAGTSVVGLAFASIALFFGLFFFIFSMKYYISIFMVLRVAQSGGRA
ncbi:MAG: helix-turn-helix domain-containing protein [Candidatus Curtissbacteria bacterium]|nr:helix-turn-helix domain-containing protein [Candidatus Curtissbacteria bacterium]